MTTQYLAENPEIDTFLSHFPHRWDFIYSDFHHPESSPIWHTEDRFSLTNRRFEQGGKLYGVRFGWETSYFVLDIDKGSIYHPKRDRFAVGKLLHALEYLGVTDHIAVTSSHSGGVHLYFPLSKPRHTLQLAEVITHALKTKGFWIEPGVLEVFPNVTLVDDEGKRSKFNAHRLPLQPGSYLISEDWDLQGHSYREFDRRWKFCTARNEINERVFSRLLREYGDLNRIRRLTYKADKFLNDLNSDIEVGWTGSGQTNFLLGRLALRGYVFGHYLEGQRQPLTGEKLVMDIVSKATRLPGYGDWCRHQHEIWQRAEEWAKCVENCRRYYPYGKKDLYSPTKLEEQPARAVNTWNEQQKQDARERLELAIAVLLHNDSLPSGTRDRVAVLTEYFRFSTETLYNHTDLWHPLPDNLGKTPQTPQPDEAPLPLASSEGARAQKTAQNLLSPTGCNTAAPIDWGSWKDLFSQQIGRNTAQGEDYSHFEGVDPVENYDKGGGG